MNDNQLLRYSRHILLDQIGIEGQQKISTAHVLVIGAGGLGSPAALYLTAAGIGKLTIADPDSVELTNLQRQILHTTARIGMLKVESARAALEAINPEVTLHTIAKRIDAAELDALLPITSVVLDCSDNFATRHAINRACVEHQVPLVSGAALRIDGQLSVFDARIATSPCYACVFAPTELNEEINCASQGVFAPLVGVIGALQAAEALKLIAGIGQALVGRLLLFDAATCVWSTIQVARNPHCVVCAHEKSRSV